MRARPEMVLTAPSDELICMFVELENIGVEDGDGLLEVWIRDEGIGEELKSGKTVSNSTVPSLVQLRRPLNSSFLTVVLCAYPFINCSKASMYSEAILRTNVIGAQIHER